jgi:hypothetical protein
LCAPDPAGFSDREHQPRLFIDFARIAAEIKLRDVSMQLFSAEVVEGSVDAALAPG